MLMLILSCLSPADSEGSKNLSIKYVGLSATASPVTNMKIGISVYFTSVWFAIASECRNLLYVSSGIRMSGVVFYVSSNEDSTEVTRKQSSLTLFCLFLFCFSLSKWNLDSSSVSKTCKMGDKGSHLVSGYGNLLNSGCNIPEH